jgi:hypothetical protein
MSSLWAVSRLPRWRPWAAACRGQLGHDLDDGHVAAVTARSDGLLLLVEELLSVPLSGIADAVPDTVAGAVARRMATLPAASAVVVQCAALLGSRFDWQLLGAITGLDEEQVHRGLQDAVGLQLLDTDPRAAFQFHHGLTRDAVVRGMLPPTRAALARRAAAVAEHGDDDAAAGLAADLWGAAARSGRPSSTS